MFRHQGAIYTLYTLTRDTSYASAWRDHLNLTLSQMFVHKTQKM